MLKPPELLRRYNLGRYVSQGTVPKGEVVSLCDQLYWTENELAAMRGAKRAAPRPVSRPRKMDPVGKKHTAMVAKYAAWAATLKGFLYEAIGPALAAAFLTASQAATVAMILGHEAAEACVIFLLTTAVTGMSKWAFTHS